MGYQSIFKDDLFAGQTVVITGGGSGIGRCTAHELAALGAEVAIVGRNADKLNAVQTEICDDGGRASIHSADIRDEAAVSDVIDAILHEHVRYAVDVGRDERRREALERHVASVGRDRRANRVEIA